MRTTSSDPGSVPTNLACVTASAMFSIAIAALSPVGSEKFNNFSIRRHVQLSTSNSFKSRFFQVTWVSWFTSGAPPPPILGKSPLPLTDPRDTVPHVHRAVYTDVDGQCDVINCDRRSPVYHADRPPN